jgi:putative ABC transport system permease protein
MVQDRLRPLALMRAVGATATQVQQLVAREAVETGGIGALVGMVAGVLLGFVLTPLVQRGLPAEARGYHPLEFPNIMFPFVALAAALVVAALAAARPASRIAKPAPGDVERPVSPGPGSARLDPVRWAFGLTLVGVGALAAAMAAHAGGGSDHRAPVVLGGMAITFLGTAVLGPALVTGAVTVLGRPLARSRTGRLAVRAALRNPGRSANLMLALVLGVEFVATLTIAVGGTDSSVAVGDVFLAIAVAIALVGVGAVISLAVDDRVHEIGVMRTVGARAGQVRNMVLVEAGLIGLAAAIIGVLVALGFSFAITGAARFHVPVGLLVVLVGGGVAGGAWVAQRPALRAARSPVLGARRAE